MILDCTLYTSYADVNDHFRFTGNRALSNDRNVEDPVLIVAVYKWSYEDGDPDGPDLGFLGLYMREHVPFGDKWDLFIYAR